MAAAIDRRHRLWLGPRCWLVHERGIEPHIPLFDKSKRTDGTFSREDFAYDHNSDTYRCPAGKILRGESGRTGVAVGTSEFAPNASFESTPLNRRVG